MNFPLWKLGRNHRVTDKRITLCTPTLNRYDLVHKLIASAEEGSLVPDRYAIVDNGGSLELNLPPEVMRKVHLWRPGTNIGVAASWNYFLKTFPDYIIISNDDIEVGRDAIKNMVQTAEDNPYAPFFCIASSGINAWSFFLERKISLEIIGEYDETFWPAYFEDNDRFYRYKLAGFDAIRAENIEFHHFNGGSSTLKQYTPEQERRHHEYFRRNQEYYTDKWGGMPHHEIFKSPWGIND